MRHFYHFGVILHIWQHPSTFGPLGAIESTGNQLIHPCGEWASDQPGITPCHAGCCEGSGALTTVDTVDRKGHPSSAAAQSSRVWTPYETPKRMWPNMTLGEHVWRVKHWKVQKPQACQSCHVFRDLAGSWFEISTLTQRFILNSNLYPTHPADSSVHSWDPFWAPGFCWLFARHQR